MARRRRSRARSRRSRSSRSGATAARPPATPAWSRLGTPYVAFLDDDSWWEPGALARAVDVLDRHPRVAVLAARVLVGDERAPRSGLPRDGTQPAAGRDCRPGPAVLGFVACGAIVRRDAFLQAGGFDARYGIGGEERPLAVRLASAGWELRYVPGVVAHHHPARSGHARRPRRADTAQRPVDGVVACGRRRAARQRTLAALGRDAPLHARRAGRGAAGRGWVARRAPAGAAGGRGGASADGAPPRPGALRRSEGVGCSL